MRPWWVFPRRHGGGSSWLCLGAGPSQRLAPAREAPSRFLQVRGARKHNLRNLDVRIPLGRFVCLTGVSGSAGNREITVDVMWQPIDDYPRFRAAR